MKWAILGAGSIANDFARYFKTERAELYAVASRSLEKATAFAEKHRIPVAYGSYEEMLADDSEHAFTHEINNFTNMVLDKADNPTFEKTRQVITIMDTLREEWGLIYPFD